MEIWVQRVWGDEKALEIKVVIHNIVNVLNTSEVCT